MKVFGKEIGMPIKFPPFIDNFFGKILSGHTNGSQELVTIPSTNISSEEAVFEINVALPGLDKKDVNIMVENHVLTVSYHQEQTKEEQNKNWIRKEFMSNSFYRAFSLPNDADPDKVHASMKNGLLKIRVGKKKVSKVKKQ